MSTSLPMGAYFGLEAFLRSSAKTADLLALDGILSDMDMEEGERLARAERCIGNLVEGEDK